METVNTAIGIAGNIIRFAFEHPLVVLFAVAVIFALLIARAIKRRGLGGNDEQRIFSPSQRAEIKRLAGGRCEASTLGWRCRAPGEHADHIYPWSRGGKTVMSNAQSLCARHNLQKSASVPSWFYIKRLEKRRAKYFPAGAVTKVEWHFDATV